MKNRMSAVLLAGCLAMTGGPVQASHQGHERHEAQDGVESSGVAHAIPGASFHVLMKQDTGSGVDTGSQADAALLASSIEQDPPSFYTILQDGTPSGRGFAWPGTDQNPAGDSTQPRSSETA